MHKLERVHILKPCPEVSLETIKNLASSYNPEEHEAPVCIGHPQSNAPAYGWVKSLEESNGNLYATLEVQDSFHKLLQEQSFKKRSVSFYDSNPPVFRHLGFLGAQPPQVKGLEEISLGESEDNLVTLSEALPEPEQEKKVESKSPIMSDFKPLVLFNLSESLAGLTPKSFKSEPIQNDDGSISGIVNLGETEYAYKLTPKDDSWAVETEVKNPEVIELSERVRFLEEQINRKEISQTVQELHNTRLTPKIISLSDCIDLVAADKTGKMLTLLQNLPNIVDMSESTVSPESKGPEESPIDFAKRMLNQSF